MTFRASVGKSKTGEKNECHDVILKEKNCGHKWRFRRWLIVILEEENVNFLCQKSKVTMMTQKVKVKIKQAEVNTQKSESQLTVPSIQGDSFQAPQHPRKPMMVT